MRTGKRAGAWLLEAGGLALIHELFADFNVISFPGGNTGVQMGGWFKPEIHSLSFYVNLDPWDKLPSSYQEILKRACLEAGFTMQAHDDARKPPCPASAPTG